MTRRLGTLTSPQYGCWFAGASMTDGLLAALSDAFKPQLFVNHYGSSEVYTVSIEQDAAAKPGSAGRAG